MFTIQRATEADVEAMHRIQMLAFEEEGRLCGTREIPPLQERPDSILDHVRSQIALVAKDRQAVVGCVRGVLAGRTCTVRALVVDPMRQGQGIGSALLRALETAVRDVERIDLTTNTIMKDNVAFYERHGYSVYDRTTVAHGIVLAHLAKGASSGA